VLPRKGFVYRIVIRVGPVQNVPVFGRSLARIVGVLKRAGHDVEVRVIEESHSDTSEDDAQ
jgi:hypothetical protein